MISTISAIVISVMVSYANPSPEEVAVLQEYVQGDYEIAIELFRDTYPDWANSYVKNEFDCSEMAAAASYYLDQCKIDNRLECGKFGPNLAHAWLWLDQDHLLEVTTLSIVWNGRSPDSFNLGWDNYLKAKKISSSITRDSEWNWFDVPYFSKYGALLDPSNTDDLIIWDGEVPYGTIPDYYEATDVFMFNNEALCEIADACGIKGVSGDDNK